MAKSEVALLFTQQARGWIGHKSNERDVALVSQLTRAGCTAFLNNYTLAFHNLHYPVVLIGDAKFLKAWSLPNPIIAVPQLTTVNEIDFLQHDKRVKTIFLPAAQIDFLDDERTRVGNIERPTFVEKLLNALNIERVEFHSPIIGAD